MWPQYTRPLNTQNSMSLYLDIENVDLLFRHEQELAAQKTALSNEYGFTSMSDIKGTAHSIFVSIIGPGLKGVSSEN